MILELHMWLFDGTYCITKIFIGKLGKGCKFYFNSKKHVCSFFDIPLHEYIVMDNVAKIRLYVPN